MIINDTTTTTNLNEQTKTQFKIKTSAKAFKILSNQLYKDKPAAIVRELSANAADSHRAANKHDVPFEVHFPTLMSPTFKVVDFGVGLTRYEVENLYTTYFDSTKNESNEYVGGLGIGSKTPLSYTQSFTVIAKKHGEQNTFIVYMDDSGQPCINCIGTTNCSEDDCGLTVEVPIQPEDIRSFRSKTNQLGMFLIPYVTFGLDKNDSKENKERYNTIRTEVKTSGWTTVSNKLIGVSEYIRRIWAVMGDIKYPIDTERDDLQIKQLMPLFDNSNGRSLIIEFNIGELDIAPSREELSYDKTTIKIIQDKMTYINSKMLERIQKELLTYTNAFDCYKLVYGMFGGFYKHLSPEIYNHITNLMFDSSVKSFAGDESLFDHKYNTPYWNSWSTEKIQEYQIRHGDKGITKLHSTLVDFFNRDYRAGGGENEEQLKLYIIGLKTTNTQTRRLNEFKKYLVDKDPSKFRIVVVNKEIIDYILPTIYDETIIIKDGDEELKKLRKEWNTKQLKTATNVIDKNLISTPDRSEYYEINEFLKENKYWFTSKDHDDNPHIYNFCDFRYGCFNDIKVVQIHASYADRAREHKLKHISEFDICDHPDVNKVMEQSIAYHFYNLFNRDNPYHVPSHLLDGFGLKNTKLNEGMITDLFLVRNFGKRITSVYSDDKISLSLLFKNYHDEPNYIPEFIKNLDCPRNDDGLTSMSTIRGFHETYTIGFEKSTKLFDEIEKHVIIIEDYIKKYVLLNHIDFSYNSDKNKLRFEHLKLYHNLIKGI